MRATNGPTTRRKRKAIKRLVEGSWGTKHTSYKIARQTLLRSKKYALRDRRQKKRDFRAVWINRISSGVKQYGYNYSSFINNLIKHKIKLNRLMISELAINHPNEFKLLVETVFKK
jgi:large subunit ribosomal protein L20